MRRARRGLVAALLLGAALSGCTFNLRHVQEPPRSVAIPTTHPWSSLVYLARTDSGVVVFDLGWTGAGKHLRRGLRRMGATPEDVRAVFLTHSHRDPVDAWREVRGARFHLTGFPGAKRIFTRDFERSRASLASLFERVKPYEVRWVCNAHGKCAAVTPAFVRRVTR